jgi:hypothetical protein
MLRNERQRDRRGLREAKLEKWIQGVTRIKEGKEQARKGSLTGKAAVLKTAETGEPRFESSTLSPSSERSEDMTTKIVAIKRPGFFGTKKNKIIADLNARYGDKWCLRWLYKEELYDFEAACTHLYEYSYMRWFQDNAKEAAFITANFENVIDNALSNVESGLDYTKQETPATHIQDIAIRRAIAALGYSFAGKGILVVRGLESAGNKYGPGNIPFFDYDAITTPYLTPWWAKTTSVESFWQSNKYICVDASIIQDETPLFNAVRT